MNPLSMSKEQSSIVMRAPPITPVVTGVFAYGVYQFASRLT